MSPSLVALVQERIDAPDWAAGNHLMFILIGLAAIVPFELRQSDTTSRVLQGAQLVVSYTNP